MMSTLGGSQASELNMPDTVPERFEAFTSCSTGGRMNEAPPLIGITAQTSQGASRLHMSSVSRKLHI